MPVHLEPDELKRLILTVGTHRTDRPLSPLEVGVLIRKATQRGTDLQDLATATHLEGTTQLGRFLKLLDLPTDTHHLIDWGKSAGGVGFTTAFEISRLALDVDKREAMNAVVAHSLNSAETRQLVQLRKRSGKTMSACIDAALKMRPTIEIRRVFIGGISDAETRARLGAMTQMQRDVLLSSCCRAVGLNHAGLVAKLGADRFTLVGPDAALADRLAKATALEKEINEWLRVEARAKNAS